MNQVLSFALKKETLIKKLMEGEQGLNYQIHQDRRDRLKTRENFYDFIQSSFSDKGDDFYFEHDPRSLTVKIKRDPDQGKNGKSFISIPNINEKTVEANNCIYTTETNKNKQLYVTIVSRTSFRVNPHSIGFQGTPCSKQAPYPKCQ